MENFYVGFEDNTVQNYCDTCGHLPIHELYSYVDEDDVLRIDYNDMVGCFDWQGFNGTLPEFVQWVSANRDQLRSEALNTFAELFGV